MKIILSLILFVSLNLGAWAQSSIPPISSADETRLAALTNVVSGSRYVYSEGIDYNQAGSVTYTNVTGTNGAIDIVKKLLAAEFRYAMFNTNDMIQGYIYLNDTCGNLIWFGGASFKRADLLAGEKAVYRLWMQYLPILQSVNWAQVIALEEDGTTGRQYYLDVSSCNQVMWPPWMSGTKNTILQVQYLNGSNVTYRVSNPVATAPAKTVEQSTFAFDHHYIYSGTNGSVLQMQILEMDEKPSVTLENVVGLQRVNLDVQAYVYGKGGGYWERATNVMVMPMGYTNVFIIGLNPGAATEITVPYACTMRFSWPTLGNNRTIYAGPEYYGGGKE